MAIQVRYIVHDDFDGTTDGVGTYRFALQGREYEIDLSPANLTRLREALAPFITAGRRLPKSSRKTGTKPSKAATPRGRPGRRAAPPTPSGAAQMR